MAKSVLNELFDEAWVLNVPEDADRLEHFVNQADRIGLEYEVFEGWGRKELIERGYFGPALDYSRPMLAAIVGRVGCTLAHTRCVQAAYDRGKTCVIFEDDVQFVRNFDETLRRLLDTLPDDWNMMRIGCGLERGSRYEVNDDWMWIGTGHWGMEAYGFHETRAMQEFVEHGRRTLGYNIDTGLRATGFGDEDTDVIAYRPIKRLASQARQFVSRCNFKTCRGVRLDDLSE